MTDTSHTGDARGTHVFDTVSSRSEYVGAIMALRVDEVRMPGGRVARREVVEHPGAVAIAAIDDTGDEPRVVLVRQYRHPLGRRLWELPAGLLDVHGEDPALTAARELAEEAGVAAARWAVLVDVAPSPGITEEVVRVYLAHGLTTADRLSDTGDEEADMEVEWVPLAEAVRLALAGDIVSSPSVAGILAAHVALGSGAGLRPADAPWTDRPTSWAKRAAG